MLIRHQKAARKTQSVLAAHGYEATILPFSEIVKLETPVPNGEFDSTIITSPIGAEILTRHERSHVLKKYPVYCVGKITAAHLKDAGYTARYSADAGSLAQLLAEGTNGRNFLYPCGRDRSFDFVSNLKSHGLACTNWEIYENRLIVPTMKEIGETTARTNVIFLYSKRTARHFFSAINEAIESLLLSSHKIIAISQNVADSIPRKFQQNTYIADNKDEISMVRCLENIDR